MRTDPAFKESLFELVDKMEDWGILCNPGISGGGSLQLTHHEASLLPFSQLRACRKQNQPGHQGLPCDAFRLCRGYLNADGTICHGPHLLCGLGLTALESQFCKGYCDNFQDYGVPVDASSYILTPEDSRYPAVPIISGMSIMGRCSHEGQHTAEDMMFCRGDAMHGGHLVCVKGKRTGDVFSIRRGLCWPHAATGVRAVCCHYV